MFTRSRLKQIGAVFLIDSEDKQAGWGCVR